LVSRGPDHAALRAASSSSVRSTEMEPVIALSVIISPFFNKAMGPPIAASGPTWPTQKPRVAPEKRPSVIRATFLPMP